MNQIFDIHTKTGAATGALLTIFANIHSEDVVKTAALAAIGAVVSFSVTLCLKVVIRHFKK